MDKKALIAVRTSIRATLNNMETLLTETGFGHDIQDSGLREMYYQLNDMALQLTQEIAHRRKKHDQ